MAIKIILVDDSGNQGKTVLNVEIQDMDWEENCYQLGCRVARAVANRYLAQKEEQILRNALQGCE